MEKENVGLYFNFDKITDSEHFVSYFPVNENQILWNFERAEWEFTSQSIVIPQNRRHKQ
jgi:hypothetical protein